MISRKKRWRSALAVTLSFLGGLGIVLSYTSTISPWDDALESYDLILVSEGCHFSEIAASCLLSPQRTQDSHTLAVSTSATGELSRRVCTDARALFVRDATPSIRLSMWILPEDVWCERLANGAREWFVDNNHREQWPAFVHEGKIVGIGLEPSNFGLVGEPAVGAHLDRCIEAFADSSQ